MNTFSEYNTTEKSAIKIFGDLWGSDNFVDAYSESGNAQLGRDNHRQVVLQDRLRSALEKLNPETPKEAIDLAVEEIAKDRSAMSLVRANHQVYKLLRDGVKVNITNDKQEMETVTVKVIDFNAPDNNDYLLVSQMWITGQLHRRRPDLIGFVNGIPLVLLELKKADVSVRNAFDENIRDYKDTIPQIFWYNAFIILSNGIENKVGTLTSGYEHFNEWKKVDDEVEEGKADLKTTLTGTCRPNRLLDIMENFTLFDESFGEPIKAVARYFQLLGVNRSFEGVKKRKENEGKLGVFWHTQGSGKSYSMIFLSQKVFRKLTGNFTFVVVTDRVELDGQIYNRFANCYAVHSEEVHAESIDHLRELLQEDHRFIFTVIHKFGTHNNEDPPVLSERDDVIVMADEAHRTQYDRLAQNMRIALPEASFLGFTGTPLLAGEEKTKQTFGDYISTYNFAQSIEDGATVPLYYENRVPKLENVNKNIEDDLEKVMDFYELSQEEEEKVEREFSTFYHLVTREDRLNKTAEDIVKHFTSRGYQGKAMVVSVDKKTTVRMYYKVKEQVDRYLSKLRMDKERTNDEREKEKIQSQIEQFEDMDMAAVISQDQNEIADMEKFGLDVRPVRERMQKEDLEGKFKDGSSNLKLVFVCAMWITGFDVPALSTMYLDKPLKNHTLMQTIARVNRVYPGKTNGLIVDYIGVFRNLQKALAIYATPESGETDPGDIIEEKQELVNLLSDYISKTKEFLKKQKLDLDKLIEAESIEKLELIDNFTNTLIKDEETKKDFLNLSRKVESYYKAVLPEPKAEDFYNEKSAIQVIATRIKEIVSEDIDVSHVKKDLEELLDDSIRAGKYTIKEYPKIHDLSAIDFEALKDFFEKNQNKNITAERLASDLEEQVNEMVKKNKTREKFLERLNNLLSEYNAGSKPVDEFFDQLLQLAQDLNEEDKRAMKENLSEEELAVFDILYKKDLNPDEEKKIKKVTQELLAKLKAEKLVLDWRKKEQTRADVRVTIRDTLYDEMPEEYSEEDLQNIWQQVYHHVFDSYVDDKENVYIEA
jgi:type I restriction enzyme R subunit